MSHSQQSKKLVNSVDKCVDECLAGLVTVNPGLGLLSGHRVVVRTDIHDVIKSGKVTLLSGGGSGHEPAHAGYVGRGMLSAAVAGAVFTSPPPHSIQSAIRAIGKDNPAGVLLIVKNYTGDRLNFGLAAERAKAEGIKVDMVVVGEDCALTSTDKTAGRRGLCGTVLIHKIAGGLAEQGLCLEDIVKQVKAASHKMGTIGLSLSPCSVPGMGPSFQLGADEIELGLGIHGEAGVTRLKLVSAKEVVQIMLDHMLNPQNNTHLLVRKGDSVCCVVNNLGGTSVLELNIIANEAVMYLENRGILVDRLYCGTFMTSLEMAGISITLLILDETLKTCLDADTSAPAWPHPLLPSGVKDRKTPSHMTCSEPASGVVSTEKSFHTISKEEASQLYDIISHVTQSLISSESRLNELDTEAGDGDCGTTLARGAHAIRDQLGRHIVCPYTLALALAVLVETDMGGTSGALYSLFLTSAAECLKTSTTPEAWSEALKQGIHAIMKYGGAEPGDRTMAADKSAQDTVAMTAHAGRASYVGKDRLTKPDAGAIAVVTWMKAILEKLT
ncbi:triokinase/FMN cyclase-like isoform X2 [Gigantopelta aegis]|uniref:triokinase/FMN cyclase-like isoform X2 n=1 Tax=Gigantopelta aegis TaxID=1735272 RepID=UPI001B88B55F|nr:triokinase/FMN cyclase-like isoform X2 [Gigantopelta aegis]